MIGPDNTVAWLEPGPRSTWLRMPIQEGEDYRFDFTLGFLVQEPPEATRRMSHDMGIAMEALETVSMFAPGRAGVVATEALVKMGVYGPGISMEETESQLELWLQAGAPMIGHEGPIDVAGTLYSFWTIG